jgi:benzoyl-CoA reductase/2-hydroxyglutaryl-CoA dehydratase subunit BcrC/BadD/HgdB
VRAFGEKVEAAGVNGVIFAAAKFCEPALYDYVLLKEELERRKIPYLSFEFEEKMTVFDTVRAQVETFVESVLFFAEEPDPAGERAP